MDLFFYIFLFIFGTMFGSFASVIIYRIRSGEGGMYTGRSHCKTCERNLSAIELIPILSWIFQGGKCRGCKKSISNIYPLLEVSMGILFTAVGYFLISPGLIFTGNIFEWVRMLFFLIIMFLTLIYVFYDILYLEIPESVLLIANILAFIALILQDLGLIFFGNMEESLAWFGALAGNNSIYFYIYVITTLLSCITVIGLLYTIMLAELKEIYDCLIIILCMLILGGLYIFDIAFSHSALFSGTVAALGVFISFFLQIILSGGRAMGAGDLRIAILMGLLVGVSFILPAWMICYLIGSIIGIILIIRFKIKFGLKSKCNHQIPFGPFIAAGYLAVVFFHSEISKFIEWYL